MPEQATAVSGGRRGRRTPVLTRAASAAARAAAGARLWGALGANVAHDVWVRQRAQQDHLRLKRTQLLRRLGHRAAAEQHFLHSQQLASLLIEAQIHTPESARPEQLAALPAQAHRSVERRGACTGSRRAGRRGLRVASRPRHFARHRVGCGAAGVAWRGGRRRQRSVGLGASFDAHRLEHRLVLLALRQRGVCSGSGSSAPARGPHASRPGPPPLGGACCTLRRRTAGALCVR